jgi:hypothetical protein
MVSTRSFEQAVIVLETEEDCKRCPMSLRCLAGQSLNFDEVDPPLHNPIGVGACDRCMAVHFLNAGQYYVCTNIRRGLHPRSHPAFPVWDAAEANEGEHWVMGAVSSENGHSTPPPEHLTCKRHFKYIPHKKFDCAVMWKNYNRAGKHT